MILNRPLQHPAHNFLNSISKIVGGAINKIVRSLGQNTSTGGSDDDSYLIKTQLDLPLATLRLNRSILYKILPAKCK
jgi:hypothetical protein